MTAASMPQTDEGVGTTPLGAHHDGHGASLALFSSVADAVEVCLFDDAGQETRFDLELGDGFVWQRYLSEVAPGQLYGFRVHGPWDPPSGARCNPAKLLLDPYARAVAGEVRWSGRPGESHPRAPTDPGVTVSRHRALLTSRQ